MAKAKVVKDNAERWLLTYSDLMNLLLILFILLYAMSQVDQAKFDALAQSLRDAFGVSTGEKVTPVSGGGSSVVPLPNNVPASSPTTVVNSKMEDKQMAEVQKKVDQIIQKGNLGDKVDVEMQERGLNISIKAQMLFKPGDADIVPGSKPTIEEIGAILKQIPGNQIRIEGHTDNDPISNAKYPSNWELSVARATNVLRLLVEKAGIDPKLIAATGYGEMRPLVPNTTAANKAANRRVNIVILRQMYDSAEAGTGGPSIDSAAAASQNSGIAGQAAGNGSSNTQAGGSAKTN